MDNEYVSERIKALNLGEKIEAEKIPSIDLYMDQVITLFENALSHTKRYEEDKLLTKTMINNYTKDKLLMPAAKKKYAKEHIMLMILLYELKHILSISDIKELFDLVIQDGEADKEQLFEIYDTYLKCRQKEADIFTERAEATLDSLHDEIKNIQIGQSEKIEDMLFVILLTEQAAYYKRLAEKIIDEKIKVSKV